MEVKPITLEGRVVRLEPVGPEHAAGLWRAANHPEIWDHIPVRVNSRPVLEALIASARAMAQAGEGLGFAIRLLQTADLVGGTSYLNVDSENRRLEIGFTWLDPAVQRTAVNTECKFLLMRHAFEELGAERVELKTDARNRRSMAALARIGATEEGRLRRHMIRPDGTFRDSVYFSVIAEEWSAVKQRLEALMTRVAPAREPK